jgi:GTPase SAR1 family protein
VIGATSVGQTCIVRRGASGVFDPSTLGLSSVSTIVNVGSAVTRLLIWDTAGHERYRSITPTYDRNAVAAIIVHSLTVGFAASKTTRRAVCFSSSSGTKRTSGIAAPGPDRGRTDSRKLLGGISKER